MSHDFLPAREAELDNWLLDFATLLTANPSAYGISSADATQVKSAVDAWHAAFIIASSPTTRTLATVQERRVKKALVVPLVRSMAARVRSNPAVSRALQVGLGLRVRDENRGAPVPPPEEAPILFVSKIDAGRHDLRIQPGAGTLGRGRPKGVASLLLYRTVADDAVNNPQAATFIGLFTRGAAVSPFTIRDRGKTATYFGRWANAKGEVGPWSNAVNAPVAA